MKPSPPRGNHDLSAGVDVRWLLIGALVGCGGKADTGASLDAATSALVDELLAASADYRSWPQTMAWTDVMPTSGGAHGEAVQIWWSPDAYEVFEAADSAPLPEGAILVKEGYADATSTELIAVTRIWKREGVFYLAQGPAGAVVDAGYEIEPCVSCHDGAPDGVLSVRW